MAILNSANQLNASRQGALGGMLQRAGQLQGLRANEQVMQRQTQQDEAAQQAAQADAEARQIGAELLQSGTPAEIASFGIQNPNVMKDFITAANFQDESAIGSRVKYAQNVLGGSVSPRAALIERINEVESAGGDAQGLKQTLQLDDDGIRLAAEKDLAVIAPKIYESFKNATAPKEQKGFTLSEGQKRYDAQGNEIASVAPKATKTTAQVSIPDVLLDGLSADLATKASAAYTAAGGGKDGMSAYQKQVDKGTEQEKRLASPAILSANFPQASPAEMAQLQGTMDAARTTETGLKAAGKVREEQKRLVKAKGFQTRAIELLSSIIDSPDIGDVTGSLEGAYDFRPFSDDESSLIADIEEAGNILTADNLSLMSGVLSESDIKILKNLAGGGLIRTRGTERFKADVTKLRDKLSSAMVVTADERAAKNKPPAQQQSDISSLSDEDLFN